MSESMCAKCGEDCGCGGLIEHLKRERDEARAEAERTAALSEKWRRKYEDSRKRNAAMENVVAEVRRLKAEKKAWGAKWYPSYESQNKLFAALDALDAGKDGGK